MQRHVLLLRTLLRAAVAAVIGTTHAAAQTWPSQPVRIVVPFGPGTIVDSVARRVVEPLAAQLGQPVVIENRPGANGILGTDFVAKARPDGYTVLFSGTSQLTINATLYDKLPYQPSRDFAPITLGARGMPLLVVDPQLPVRSLPELIAYAKSRPGKLAYGSPGVGSVQHVAMEAFEREAGLFLVHIPYKNSADAMTDLIGGRIQLLVDYAPVTVPHVLSGRARALAVAGGDRRKPALPDVPTAVELGMPALDGTAWNAFVVPAATPPDIVARLNQALTTVLGSKEFKDWLAPFGSEAIPSTPAEAARFIESETSRWAKVVKAAGMHAE